MSMDLCLKFQVVQFYYKNIPEKLKSQRENAGNFTFRVECEPCMCGWLCFQVVWRGRNGHAFLVFENQEKCEEAKELLQGLTFEDKEATVSLF